MKIVVLDKAHFLSDFPNMSFDCIWEEYPDTKPEDILTRLSGADIAVTHNTIINEAHFRFLPKLKMITTNSTGYNTIDSNAASRYNITVCNVQDWCTNSVVEHVLAFIFSLKRNIVPYHQDVRKGLWAKKAQGSYAILHTPGTEIAGSTLGIFGYGVLGKHLKEKAAALGMRVLISERKNGTAIRYGYTEFYEAVAKSDVVVLLAPLNSETHKLFSAKELNQMKPQAILINCGRGGLVDEAALLGALTNNKIGGAALDVIEQEPPEATNPLLTYTGSNLLISSHVAFSSIESIASNTGQIVKNIEGFYSGNPQNVVN